MSRLEVVFRLGLAHPLLLYGSNPRIARTTAPETGNRVWIKPPTGAPWPEPTTGRGVFSVLHVHVERECSREDRDAVCYAKLVEWGIVRDAANALWRALEYIREGEFLGKRSSVAGYPVVPSEAPQSNPVVQTAVAEITFDGEPLSPMALGGIPTITITHDAWNRV